MVLAEKCPNCGANLPPRVAGAATRTCDFCDQEFGEAPQVQAPAFTPESARAAILEALRVRHSMQRPAAPDLEAILAARRAATPRAGTKLGCVMVVVIVVMVGGIAGAIFFAKRAQDRAMAPVRALQAAQDDYADAQAAAVQAAGGYRALDGVAMLGFATKAAQHLEPDAALTSISLSYVKADGTSDLTLGDNGNYYQFRSPTKSRPPAGTPVGVEVRQSCRVQVNVTPKYAYAPAPSDYPSSMCRDPLVRPPTCAPREIMARAGKDGAPSNAVASLRYDVEHDEDKGERDVPRRGQWRIDISHLPPNDDSWWHEYEDDCGDPLEPAPAVEPSGPRPPASTLPAATAIELDVLARRKTTLGICLARAAAKHPAIDGARLEADVALDGKGNVDKVTATSELHIEGLFQGDLAAVTRAFTDCAGKAIAGQRFPVSAAHAFHATLAVERH